MNHPWVIPNATRPVEDPLDWQAAAECATTDPELFVPDKGGTTAPAKRICAGCEVREKCLQWALDNDERRGIYGGLSAQERRRLRKKAA